MIDTHSHLIPYFDDGSADWEMSLDMLRQGEEDGITEVVCTPHIMSKRDFDREDELMSLYEQLQKRVKDAGLSIKLHLGAELYVQPDLELDRQFATIAGNGRYFLVEFPMNIVPDFVTQHFFEMVMDDKIPVIAHPERNGRIINEPEKAYEFVERGALLQVNSGSLLGIFGKVVKSVAIKLMDANLVTLIGSDAHDLRSRPFKLKQAFEFVKETWGIDRAQHLFYDNPRHILQAEDVIHQEPRPIESEEKKSSLNPFRWFAKNK